ncbi:MAG TPA: M20 family metallopeptidase [Thermoanaerobaculia bacterium]|nr:M20 family metallopeptidase [Thermoanaerobaculia bacterium]
MKALLDRLRARQGEMVELLRRLAVAESPSHVPAAQEPVFALLEETLAPAGYRVRRLPGKASGGQLYASPARRPRARRAQLLLGHCDTVWPLGSLATMPVALADGRLTGPGVYDMKAGLVQGVFALRALAEQGLEPPLAPVLFVSSDEEVGSEESTARIERLARRVARVFVLEPSLEPGGRLKTERKGNARFTVTAHGKAAHAGLEPEKGASAVLELAHQVIRLHALGDPAKGTTVTVGIFEGGIRRNVVPPEAKAVVDVRMLRFDDFAALERAIRGLVPAIPGTRLEVEGGIDRPPLERTPGNRALWEQARAVAARLGLDLQEGTAGGASDGNTTSVFAPTLDGLGPVGDGAHAAHEFVWVDRMPERAALLAGLLMEPEAPAGTERAFLLQER